MYKRAHQCLQRLQETNNFSKGSSKQQGVQLWNREGKKLHQNIYKINELVEKPKMEQAPSNLAIVGRYILTPDIFEKISETEPGFNGEIQLTDALSKLDELYAVKFEGKVFNIENRLEWIKSSIDYAMYDSEFRDDLIDYMKTFVG